MPTRALHCVSWASTALVWKWWKPFPCPHVNSENRLSTPRSGHMTQFFCFLSSPPSFSKDWQVNQLFRLLLFHWTCIGLFSPYPSKPRLNFLPPAEWGVGNRALDFLVPLVGPPGGAETLGGGRGSSSRKGWDLRVRTLWPWAFPLGVSGSFSFKAYSTVLHCS